MTIADELRTAGLVVIEGRAGIGRTFGVPGVDVVATGTGKSREGADDINNIVAPARGVAYVERSGRVWLLADGPVNPGPAVVFQAQYRDEEIAEQADAVAVVVAVLGDVYALSATDGHSNASDGDLTPDPVDLEEESGDAQATGDEG